MVSNYKIIRSLIGLLIFISSPIILNASHIVGGKITYRFLGSGNYEIKLTVYRDCSDPIDFDNPATLTIFDAGTNAIVYNHQILIFHRDTIHPVNPDPCFIPPAGICVEQAYYLDTVNLPNNISGYTASYQRCCHNTSLLNILNPGFSGTTITANIPPQNNNSANFQNFPPIYVCVNDTFNYSFASTDIDGDSLVYQMCSPLMGGTNFTIPNPASPPPYIPVTWSNTYTASQPLSTTNGVNFNSSNGTIHFIPTIQGQYAVGICVLEYRNGNLLNTNRLEVQFNVVPCYLVSSIPTSTNLCQGLTINFQNGSTNATTFHWDFGDNTVISDTSNLTSPSYSYPSFGTYTVSLVAINSSYGTCRDTTTKVINVNPLLAPALPSSYSACYKNNNIPLLVGGTFDSSASFMWDLGNYATPNHPTIHNPTVHFDTLQQNISVIVSQFGCSDTLTSSINFINPVASFNTGNLNCSGKSLNFTSFSSNANTVFWDFGLLNSLSDTSSLVSLNYTYPTFGSYTVTLIAYNSACSDTMKLPLNVSDTLKLFPINKTETQCLRGNSFNFLANGQYSNNAIFTWMFDNSASVATSNQENPTNISFATTGTHAIKLLVNDNGCFRQRIHSIKVFPNPKALFSVSDTAGCLPLTNHLSNLSTSSIPYTSTWHINNDYFKGVDTTYIFNSSGLYSISLSVKDTNNCVDTLHKINYIEVYPLPKALALVTPTIADIINPVIQFTDQSQGSHSTKFSFGDDEYSSQTIANHTYANVGAFNYSLTVVNDFGCSDTVNGVIIIEDNNSIYIPNSFTPNNDNLNDSFKPIISNYKSANLKIFDRWGELIYSTNNIENGWDGVYKGANSPPEVYVYQLSVNFMDGKTKVLKGSVTLIR